MKKIIFIILLFLIALAITLGIYTYFSFDYSQTITKLEVAREDIISNSTATTYYVSATGTSLEGTDINNPMSLKTANEKIFNGNDKILFKCGDIFYGKIGFQVNNSSNDEYVYVGTYGEGDRPIISGANILINENAWEKEENLYKIDLSNYDNFVGIGRISWDIYNIGFLEDEQGCIYGNRKKNKEELKNEFDFYCEDNYLYILCSENPTTKLGEIKFTTRTDLVEVSSNMIIEGLQIQNTGAHGIVKNESYIENVYIRDCIIQNIGGCVQVADTFTRYGNGIEFWNQAKDTLIENCIIRNVYDAAYTIQGDSSIEGFENNIFRNNIVINCTYDIEICSYDQSNSNIQSKIINCVNEDNISINQGRGWGYDVRPNKEPASILVLWRNQSIPDKTDITLKNNKYFNFRNIYYTYMAYDPILPDKYSDIVNSQNNYLYTSDTSTLVCGKGSFDERQILDEYGQEKNSYFNNINYEEIKLVENAEIINSNDCNKIKEYFENLEEQFALNDAKNLVLNEYSNMTEIISDKVSSDIYNDFKDIEKNIENINNETSVEETMQQIEQIYLLGNNIITDTDIDNSTKETILNKLEITINQFQELIKLKDIDNIIVDTSKTLEKIEKVKEILNDNSDLDIDFLEELLNESEVCFAKIDTNQNYLNEYYNMSAYYLADWVDRFIQIYIDEYIEANPVTVSYSNTSEWTNEDVIATLNIGDDSKVTNNNGINTYTFNDNGTFTFEYERRGQAYKIEASVSNIDKQAPSITGVENGKIYTNSARPVIEDENIASIKLTFNDATIIEYVEGIKLTEEGKYNITALDKAGNETSLVFYVVEEGPDGYIIQNNYILNVWKKTTVTDFEENFNLHQSYTIKRNDVELTDTDIVATGDILELSSGDKYTIIVAGDINADGRVSVFDLSILRRYILRLQELTELQALAADINVDGKELTVQDYSRMRIEILGIY